MQGYRVLAFTTKGKQYYDKVEYKENDILLFGSETAGLPDDVLEEVGSDCKLRVPMCADARSLNLSNTVAIVSYEAWRQQGFTGGK